MEFVKILIFITVDIFKHIAKKIRKLNEQIKFYGTTLSESFMCEIIDIRNLIIFLKIYCDEGLSTIFPLWYIVVVNFTSGGHNDHCF